MQKRLFFVSMILLALILSSCQPAVMEESSPVIEAPTEVPAETTQVIEAGGPVLEITDGSQSVMLSMADLEKLEVVEG